MVTGAHGETSGEDPLYRLTRAMAHDMNNILTIIGGNVDWLMKHAAAHFPGDQDVLANVLSATREGAAMLRSIETYVQSASAPDTYLPLDDLMDHVIRLARRLLPRPLSLRGDPESALVTRVSLPAWTLGFLVDRLVELARSLDAGELRVTTEVSDPALHPCVPAAFDAEQRLRLTVRYSGNLDDRDALERMQNGLKLTPTFAASAAGDSARLSLSGAPFEIPAAVTASPPTIAFDLPCHVLTAATPDARAAGHGEHIVVLDDETMITHFVQHLLESQGYRVDVFHSGKEFLGHVNDEACPIDLAVIDGRLPDITGAECVQALHEQRRTVPAIFISGSSDLPDEIKACVCAMLEKPFAATDLLQAVHRALTAAGKSPG